MTPYEGQTIYSAETLSITIKKCYTQHNNTQHGNTKCMVKSLLYWMPLWWVSWRPICSCNLWLQRSKLQWTLVWCFRVGQGHPQAYVETSITYCSKMFVKLSQWPGANPIPFLGVYVLAIFGKLDPFTIEEFLISALKRSSLQIILRKFITKR